MLHTYSVCIIIREITKQIFVTAVENIQRIAIQIFIIVLVQQTCYICAENDLVYVTQIQIQIPAIQPFFKFVLATFCHG